MQKAGENYAKRLLAEYSGLAMSSEEFEHFQRLCRYANPELLRNALKELRGAAMAARRAREAGRSSNHSDRGFLTRVHRVYNWKLAEQHRLFPVLSLFEGSCRGFLALWMESHYQTGVWWRELYEWLREGGRGTDLTAINGIPTSHGVLKTVEHLLRGIDGDDLSGRVVPEIGRGQDLLQLSKLSDLEHLFTGHWSELKAVLPDRLHQGAPLDAQVFEGMFRRIRKARNTCFHHRKVADRHGVVSNIETLLELLSVHAESTIDGVAAAFVKPFRYQVAYSTQFADGLPPPSEFDFEISSSAGTEKHPVVARTRSEALHKAVDALNVAEREGFASLALRAAPAGSIT